MSSIQSPDQSSNARIFVRGLPVRIEKDTIVEYFSQFGRVVHCKLKRNNKTKRSMGYACLTFESAEVAQSLIDRPLDFHGRICECKPVLKTRDLEEHLTREKQLKVKLGNLDPFASNLDLQQALAALTRFAYAYVVKEQPDSDENKGFGFVMFGCEQEAAAFCHARRPLFVRGRKVQVLHEGFAQQAERKSDQAGQFRAVGSSTRTNEPCEAPTSQRPGTHTAGTPARLRQSTGPLAWPESEARQTGVDARQATPFSLWSASASSRHISSGGKGQAPTALPGRSGRHSQSDQSDQKSSSASGSDGSYRSLSRCLELAFVSGQIDERVENYRFNTPNSSLGKKSPCAAMPSQPAPKFLRTCPASDTARQQASAV